jgi:serine/threonine-protein kinase
MKESSTDAQAAAIGDHPTALSTAPSAVPQGGLSAGAMVSEYRVERELGRGGMGVVYAGTQPVIGKRVAIKVLSAAASGDPSLGRRFVEEARAVNRIAHPNIIDIFAFGQLDDGRLYFVMEYLDGETLAQVLEHKALELPQVCRLLAQVADALDAAHTAGIVHRDLKPENLWVATPKHGEPFIKVLDFGIAKLLADASERGITATGAVIGTPYYMAPEQCMGRSVDARADIYALGVILYLATTGRLPFTGSSLAEIVSQHVVRTPQAPSELSAELPDTLGELVLACLEKDPAQRPQRARDVAQALRAIAQGSAAPSGIFARSVAPASHAALEPAAELNRPRASRRWVRPLMLTALLIVAAAVALWVQSQQAQPDEPTVAAPVAPIAAPTAQPKPAAPAAPKSALPVEAADEPAVPVRQGKPEPKNPRSTRSRATEDGLIRENPF